MAGSLLGRLSDAMSYTCVGPFLYSRYTQAPLSGLRKCDVDKQRARTNESAQKRQLSLALSVSDLLLPPSVRSIPLNLFSLSQITAMAQAFNKLGGIFPKGSGKGLIGGAGALIALGTVGYGINAALFNGK